jgi:hypothetical protein
MEIIIVFGGGEECDGQCVERATEALDSVEVEKIEHNDESYYNANDIERLLNALLRYHLTRIGHTEGAVPDRQQLVAVGLNAMAVSFAQRISGSLVEGQVPDAIPEDWLTLGDES